MSVVLQGESWKPRSPGGLFLYSPGEEQGVDPVFCRVQRRVGTLRREGVTQKLVSHGNPHNTQTDDRTNSIINIVPSSTRVRRYLTLGSSTPGDLGYQPTDPPPRTDLSGLNFVESSRQSHHIRLGGPPHPSRRHGTVPETLP